MGEEQTYHQMPWIRDARNWMRRAGLIFISQKKQREKKIRWRWVGYRYAHRHAHRAAGSCKLQAKINKQGLNRIQGGNVQALKDGSEAGSVRFGLQVMNWDRGRDYLFGLGDAWRIVRGRMSHDQQP